MTMPTPTDPAQPAAVPTAPAPAPTAPIPAPVAPVPPQPLTGQVPAAPVAPQWALPPAMPQAPAAPTAEDERDLSRQPKWVQDEITKLRTENAARRVSERAASVSQHAFLNAAALGVDGHALLGSAAFQAAAQTLDPKAPDFQAQLTAKVSEILAANPWVAARSTAPTVPTPPPQAGRSGGEFPGGSGAGQPISEAQLAAMSADDIAKALAEGKLQHLL